MRAVSSGRFREGARSESNLDLPRHGQKGLLDVGSVLCRGLQEGDSKAVGKFLSVAVD